MNFDTPEKVKEHNEKRIEKINQKTNVLEHAVAKKFKKKFFKNTTLEGSSIYINSKELLKLLSEVIINFPTAHRNVFGQHLLEDCRNIMLSYTRCYHSTLDKITYINNTINYFEELQADIKMCLDLELITKSKIFNIMDLETRIKNDIKNFKCSLTKKQHSSGDLGVVKD